MANHLYYGDNLHVLRGSKAPACEERDDQSELEI